MRGLDQTCVTDIARNMKHDAERYKSNNLCRSTEKKEVRCCLFINEDKF